MEESEKIINALKIIHQENVIIMQGILRFACYPQDYQKASDQIEKDWNNAFNASIGEKTE